ncbi:MAG: HEAT repeat domain-containing protein [Acidobacteriota bacterium]|nr:HEAT repeat domain-containing protein [Acidobacteriota bacterium]
MNKQVEEELIKRGKQVLPVFREQFNSPEEYLEIEMPKRLMIINVLKKTKYQEGIEMLIDFLKEECEKPYSGERWSHMPKEIYIKRMICLAFRDIGKEGVAILERCLSQYEVKHDDLMKRLIIATGLAGDDKYFETIAAYLLEDQDPWIREISALALGSIGDKRAIPYLEMALQDDFCFELGADPGSDVVLSLITSCPVREAAVHGLDNLGIRVKRQGNAIWIEKG